METNKKNYEIVDGVEKLEAALARARAAQKIFATYTQEQVDFSGCDRSKPGKDSSRANGGRGDRHGHRGG